MTKRKILRKLKRLCLRILGFKYAHGDGVYYQFFQNEKYWHSSGQIISVNFKFFLFHPSKKIYLILDNYRSNGIFVPENKIDGRYYRNIS